MVVRQWIRQDRSKEKLNVKRVRRRCGKSGLTLSRGKLHQRGGQSVRIPCRAEYPNHVWAYDFILDALENGRNLKILTVEDQYTRQALAVEMTHSLKATAVAQTLLRLFRSHGAPRYVRSDNGREFMAKALKRRFKEAGVTCRHIDPGSPWPNGIKERFNGTLRWECLDMETFGTASHAQALCQRYCGEYNRRRPHSSLPYRTARRVCGADRGGGFFHPPPHLHPALQLSSLGRQCG